MPCRIRFPDCYNEHGLDCKVLPEIPQCQFGNHPPQIVHNQFECANQVSLLENIDSEFSANQAAFMLLQTYPQDEQWATKETYPSGTPSVGYFTSPSLAQLLQPYNRNDCQQFSGLKGVIQPNPDLHSLRTSDLSQASQFRLFTVGQLRYQSSVDFGEDIVRNSQYTINENIFAYWCWGLAERYVSQTAQEGFIHWGINSKFGSPRCSSTTFAGEPAHSQPLTPMTVSGQRDIVSRDVTARPKASLRGGLPQTSGEHPINRPVLRKRKGHRNVLSACRAMPMDCLGPLLFEQRPAATVDLRREKLTEEQRRRNHILHEQKRRAIIKEGFDGLLNLVPDLKHRGLTKSAILFKAAELLEALTSGNKSLRAQIRVLEGAEDTSPSKPTFQLSDKTASVD